jgi:hypothetical protein
MQLFALFPIPKSIIKIGTAKETTLRKRNHYSEFGGELQRWRRRPGEAAMDDIVGGCCVRVERL